MIYLFSAAWCIYLAVDSFKKSRNTFNMVGLLLFGVGFTTLGLVEFMELMAPEWVQVSFWALVGMLGLCGGITGLCFHRSPNSPRWQLWTMLVFGIGLILYAGYLLFYYWR